MLQCLFLILIILKSTDTEIYADLPGLRASDSPPATVPLHVLVTSARPDIVIIEDATITLLELTIPVKVVGTLSPMQLLAMTSGAEIRMYVSWWCLRTAGYSRVYSKQATSTSKDHGYLSLILLSPGGQRAV